MTATQSSTGAWVPPELAAVIVERAALALEQQGWTPQQHVDLDTGAISYTQALTFAAGGAVGAGHDFADEPADPYLQEVLHGVEVRISCSTPPSDHQQQPEPDHRRQAQRRTSVEEPDRPAAPACPTPEQDHLTHPARLKCRRGGSS